MILIFIKQQTEVEEESDELDYSSQMDRSRMSQAGQLPQPSQSTLSEAALRKHNAENVSKYRKKLFNVLGYFT